jgi:hypothetical protein
MAENKLEEIIDLLAKYGGFNREYLRDKLLTFANDGHSETKNKMIEVASNQMAFPDTWEEFEKHYGFYDSKQVYMFGNTRLIPSFRVQQWLDHLDDVNRKKQSQKNKMEQIAKMFGKELDERFTIRMDNEKFDAMFMLSGLWLMGAYENPYVDVDTFVLRDLLTGRAEIAGDEK